MIMSEYYKCLLPVAATRYLAKLRVLGLEETDDPYRSKNERNSFVFAPTRFLLHNLTSLSSLVSAAPLALSLSQAHGFLKFLNGI